MTEMSDQSISRRHFLRGEFLSSLKPEHKQLQQTDYLRPPWAINNADFVENCTRCGDCILVCETNIIVKGEGDFPEIRFDKGECTFCQKCVLVCQQPIFRPLEEQPWAHKIEITSQCLSEKRVECRSCQDNCPTSAIRFRLQLGGVAKPILNLESCNGCGACLSVCPTKAIKIINFEVNKNESI